MIIRTLEELNEALRVRAEKHYVYVLRYPDNVPIHGGLGTPFYVGIGQRNRLFSHEEAALHGEQSEKADAIRAIASAGKQVVRTIDSFHSIEPFLREAELIHEIGRKAEGKGPLLNAQTYAPSAKIDGVEVRKYAAEQAAAGSFDAIPDNFKLRNTRLMAGPEAPKSRTSVMGKVYSTVESNPGITGEELLRLLQNEDFTGNKSAYTQSGQVCAAWLVGYIDGACFHPRARHIQPHSDLK
jgi:hypothetical protein